MPTTFITGDLFTTPDLDALAHGVNCAGAMGAGIARGFRRRWPAMYRDYRAECDASRLRPGYLFAWRGDGVPHWIYNLATQDRPGARASHEFVMAALIRMVRFAATKRDPIRRIGLPRIGCGIGGLDWADVRETIVEVGADTAIELVVVSLPGDD